MTLHPKRTTFPSLAALWLAALTFSHGLGAQPPTAEEIEFFEKSIRPVLVESCYECHSEKAQKIKGELLLDTREGIRKGGENGPAVVPGDLEKSLLIEAIRYKNAALSMPPNSKGGKLPDSVLADFERWVKMGAPDPRESTAKKVAKHDTGLGKKWWSYQPVQKPAVPQPKDATWARSDIDRFILAGLEGKGLKPAVDADAHTLLRRIYMDLTGLPPSPEAIESFTQNPGKDLQSAIATVVDRLSQSPQYGERWGRHWLDVARYAETSGRDANVVFPEAWRYRDYVVGAFDEDKPFDQFIREQLAGDLLPDKSDEERAKNLIATGFLSVGPKSLNETIARKFATDLADEQIDATSQAFLGVTIACARCHDHKSEPISQRDYTALAGIFLSTDTRFGSPGGVRGRNITPMIEMPATLKIPMVERHMDPSLWQQKTRQLTALKQRFKAEMAIRRKAGSGPEAAASAKGLKQGAGSPVGTTMTDYEMVRLSTRIKQLQVDVSAFNADGSPKPRLMGVLDRNAASSGRSGPRVGPKSRTGFENIGDAPLFARGGIDKEGEKVARGFPEFLSHGVKASINSDTSGRLELANWIASPQNPLTSRVIVNRVWHWLFGRGIVASVDNFGTTGCQPSHAALLDHLATRFTEQGWSVKKLIREIMLSRAYQLSCAHDESSFRADPDNILVWRMNQRRLDAECMRDAMLASSGALDFKRQIGSLLAQVGDGPVGGSRFSVITEDVIIKTNGKFRSLYLPIARNAPPDTLSIFDFPDPAVVLGARETTTAPPQALFLMNSKFVEEQSAHFAARIWKAVPPGSSTEDRFDERFKLACLLAWARPPDAEELKAAREFMSRQPASQSEAALVAVCRALFGSAEFRYLN